MFELVFRGRDRPLLIWIAPVVLVLISLEGLLFLLVAIIDGGAMTVGVADQPVTTRQFRLLVGPIIAAPIVLQFVLAYGFLAQRPWARPLAVALPFGWFVVAALISRPATPWTALVVQVGLPSVILSMVVAMYLYGRSSARAYYRRLSTT